MVEVDKTIPKRPVDLRLTTMMAAILKMTWK